MDFRDTPDEAAFRAKVRAFVAEHLPADSPLRRPGQGYYPETAEEKAAYDAWRQAVSRRGWIAPHWPKEYGGAGMSPVEQFIFNEEMAEARAPQLGGAGVTHIGPILIMYGTEEQRQEHLPRVTSGEVAWAQGYSEPGSGSDLASLQTRAVRDGDDYIVNGQKIWSSGAHRSDWMFALVRTDPEAPKHRGISMLMFDLKTPGITIRPLVNLAGDHHFNEVFFDNVRVPVRNRVGEENRGWYLGAALLDHERSMIRPVVTMRHSVNDLNDVAREARRDGQAMARVTAPVRAELAERSIEVDIAKLFSYRLISMQKRGLVPNYEASMNWLYSNEARQRITKTGIKLISLYGNVFQHPRYAPLAGRIAYMYLHSVSDTIQGGTSEIQRNVIATRGLGLPRA